MPPEHPCMQVNDLQETEIHVSHLEVVVIYGRDFSGELRILFQVFRMDIDQSPPIKGIVVRAR